VQLDGHAAACAGRVDGEADRRVVGRRAVGHGDGAVGKSEGKR
jgi:hypothetical protein